MPKKVYLFATSSHPDAISISSLDIVFLQAEIDFSHYDYFIITSKQTSKALKYYDKNQYAHKPALCVSKQSALAYEKIGGNILELGNGYGHSLKPIIQSYAKETRWLYLRAKEVATNFASQCREDGYAIDEAILYESCCSKNIINAQIEADATLIFTSPSGVKCFLSNNTIHPTNKVIVIGKTTALALASDIQYTIASQSTIESCMKLI